MRTFVAKTTVNFPDFELYVRIGDLLVFDPTKANNLTVYRGGSIVKTIKTTSIAIAAMLKVKMLEEVINKLAPPAPKPAPAAPKKPAEAPKAPKPPKAESKKEAPKKEPVINTKVPVLDAPEIKTTVPVLDAAETIETKVPVLDPPLTEEK